MRSRRSRVQDAEEGDHGPASLPAPFGGLRSAGRPRHKGARRTTRPATGPPPRRCLLKMPSGAVVHMGHHTTGLCRSMCPAAAHACAEPVPGGGTKGPMMCKGSVRGLTAGREPWGMRWMHIPGLWG